MVTTLILPAPRHHIVWAIRLRYTCFHDLGGLQYTKHDIRHHSWVSRLTDRVPMQRMRRILFAVLAVLSLGLAVWLAVARDEITEETVGVAGLFIAIAALAVSLAQLLPAPSPPPPVGELADNLAMTVREQWTEEVTARSLRNPRVIPVAWSATERPVADSPDSITGTTGARILRLSLSGRLDGRFDECVSQLAHAYRQVPSGRLVILGEPGAGKTVLAIMLTLGLLDDTTRPAGGTVPVVLAMSTWDPVGESLDDWIVDTLATSNYNGRPEIPRRLLTQGLLLPVLDGLDEVPETARRSAVRAIDRACGDGRGIVLTCRSEEYEDVITGGAPVLLRAPVVEVEPVPPHDAIVYLDDVAWPASTTWEPVQDRLVTEPDSPLSKALSTPLMISLARTVYQRCGRSPNELLEFASRHAVEDHLTDLVVTAAYAPGPAAPDQQADGSDWKAHAERAERWLTYLAKYLHRSREHDLAWWLMSHRLLSRWAGPLVGIGSGTLVMTAVLLFLPVLDTQDELDGELFEVGATVGSGFAIVAMIIWYAAPDRPPGRLSFAVRGSLGRLSRGFATGVALSAIPLLPFLMVGMAATSVTTGWSTARIAESFMTVTALASMAAVVGLALAVHSWLDAPSKRSTGASPLGFLEQDRRSSLLGASTAGLVLGLIGVPMLMVGLSAGFLGLLAVTGWSNEPSLVDVIADLAGTSAPDLTDPLTFGGVIVLPGIVFALLTLLTRAWPRFLLVRLVVAVRGHLPWRLMRFLAEARERQLLRQHGGTYQFRHMRLQERLTSRSLAEDRSPTAIARAAQRRRRIRVAGVVAVLLAAWLTLAQALPEDSSQATLVGGVGMMAFSPDGAVVTTIGDDGMRRWNTDTADEIGNPLTVKDCTAKRDVPVAVAMTSTTTAVTANYQKTSDRGMDTVVIVVCTWDLATGEQVDVTHMKTSPDEGPSHAILSGDGTRLVVMGAGETRMFNTETGDPVDTPLRHSLVLAVNADGSRLAVGGREGVWIVGAETGREWGPFRDVRALSVRGARVATASEDRAEVWEMGAARTKMQIGNPLTGHLADIEALTLSADGRRLATTDSGHVTRLWKLPNG
ncbi:hypothetical protein [Streptomyces sp. NPDC018833]|uniref:hypothetical protein n=1 Tax=Streptomyces sp. NPDC018833 TaxID=3365053 RepID=UPI0037970068